MAKPVVKKKSRTKWSLPEGYEFEADSSHELSRWGYAILLRHGMAGLLAHLESQARIKFEMDHVSNTPNRFVKALEEMVEGCFVDPRSALAKSFSETKYSQLIVVRDIDFHSLCAHHFLPFIGKVHFGYLPDKKIVGLSKIPRLVEILAHRPQIQEQLSQQIVDTFQQVIKPKGCGVLITANHLCMSVRGIKKAGSITETTALTGSFLTNDSLKQEFLQRINHGS